MKGWRPEGWENPTLSPSTALNLDESIARSSFSAGYEAGSSAMLEALKREGIESPSYSIIECARGKKGTWVFIPEVE